jgi:hypothetical protein
VAGGGIDLHTHGYRYDDSHGDEPIVSVCFDLLDEVVRHAPNLRAITLEIFGARFPHKAVARLRSLRERPAVSAWLEGRAEPAAARPSLADAQERTRAAVVGVYDLLHGSEPVSGRTLAAAGEAALGSFAPVEQQRWEYERAQRLRLHGTNVSSYYPLTTRWLMRREALDEMGFFERLVPALGGSDTGIREKTDAAFEDLVSQAPEDRVGPELFRVERWMNECATDPAVVADAEFSIHLPRVIQGLRTGCLQPSRLLTAEPLTVRHLGECRFEVVGEAVSPLDTTDLPATGVVPPAEPGRAACCTGQ